MKQRIGKPENKDIVLPIWVWDQREGKRKRRDLRYSGYADRGTKMVQIEFEIPLKNVLLSDFDAWHLVLNKYYFGNDTEVDNFEKNIQIVIDGIKIFVLMMLNLMK